MINNFENCFVRHQKMTIFAANSKKSVLANKNMDDFKDLKAPVALAIDKVEPNTGQLKEQGLPENPRTIRDERFEQLKENIKKYPQFLEKRSLIVYPFSDDKYIIIAGNQRYDALSDLKYKHIPCHILDKNTPIDTLKAYAILDNVNSGQWDWQKLQGEEWDTDQLNDWGVECDFLSDDFFVEEDADNGETLDDYKEPEKDYLECPFCHKADSKSRFKKVTAPKTIPNPTSSDEDISLCD